MAEAMTPDLELVRRGYSYTFGAAEFATTEGSLSGSRVVFRIKNEGEILLELDSASPPASPSRFSWILSGDNSEIGTLSIDLASSVVNQLFTDLGDAREAVCSVQIYDAQGNSMPPLPGGFFPLNFER